MQDVYENIDEHNPDRKYELLIVFDFVTVDMVNNKDLIK